MAHNIVNINNSFIQWCETHFEESWNDYNRRDLPINNKNDLQFMLEIQATTTVYLDSIAFYLIRGEYDEGESFAASDIIHTLAHQYALISGTNYAVAVVDLTCTPGDLANTTYGAEENECIHLVIATTADKQIVCKSLQSFRYVSDRRWTQVIRYGCTDNAFNFYYEEVSAEILDQFYNQIRLPITLDSPRPITQKKGFLLSSGAYQTLKANKQKEYRVDTDYLNEHQHMCLDAAIDHDLLYIFERAISGCDYTDYEYHHPEGDDYEISWQEGPGQHLGVAKAQFHLNQTPYYSKNSNC